MIAVQKETIPVYIEGQPNPYNCEVVSLAKKIKIKINKNRREKKKKMNMVSQDK